MDKTGVEQQRIDQRAVSEEAAKVLMHAATAIAIEAMEKTTEGE